MAYDSNQMSSTRRSALVSLLSSAALAAGKQEFPNQNDRRNTFPELDDTDKRLPNGKSQKDAIAREQHEQVLKDANDLITLAENLRDELQKAGDFVVPAGSLKKTEQIEKLAKKIRGRLQL